MRSVADRAFTCLAQPAALPIALAVLATLFPVLRGAYGPAAQ